MNRLSFIVIFSSSQAQSLLQIAYQERLSMKTKPLIQAGTILGVGVGGFFVEIFQSQHVFFHVFYWVMILWGIVSLWLCAGREDVPHSTSVLAGGFLQGWGVFNLVDGIIAEQMTGKDHLYYDLAFLISGVIMISVGRFLYHDQSDRRTHQRRERHIMSGRKTSDLRT